MTGNCECFPTKVAIIAAIRPRGQEHRPPFAVGKLNQVGVAGAVDGGISAQVAVGEDGIARIDLVGTLNLPAAENGDAMVVIGAAFGDHQIVPAADFVQMRPFWRHCVVNRAVCAEYPPLADQPSAF